VGRVVCFSDFLKFSTRGGPFDPQIKKRRGRNDLKGEEMINPQERDFSKERLWKTKEKIKNFGRIRTGRKNSYHWCMI
jgi:hypothetical protein